MTIVMRLSSWFKNTDKKKIIEIVSASMSIPVLTTVFLLNLNNLKKTNAVNTPSIVPTPQIETIVVPTEKNVDITPVPTKFVCKKEVGPVEIVSPQDNQLITQDPINIEISYNKDEYCPLVWSYRLDNNQWSDYTDKVISLYNLSSGDKNLDVKVKSVAGGDEITLQRKFSYINSKISPTAIPTTIPTSVNVSPTATTSSGINK